MHSLQTSAHANKHFSFNRVPSGHQSEESPAHYYNKGNLPAQARSHMVANPCPSAYRCEWRISLLGLGEKRKLKKGHTKLMAAGL